MRFNHKMLCPKDSEGTTNNLDPEVYTVCPDLPVQILGIIMTDKLLPLQIIVFAFKWAEN